MASKRELEARIGGLQRQVNEQRAIIERIAAELDIPIAAPAAQAPAPGQASTASGAGQLPTLPPASVEALASGNKVLAIKLLRQESYPSLSLKDAKDIVEAHEKGGGAGLGPGSAWV